MLLVPRKRLEKTRRRRGKGAEISSRALITRFRGGCTGCGKRLASRRDDQITLLLAPDLVRIRLLDVREREQAIAPELACVALCWRIVRCPARGRPIPTGERVSLPAFGRLMLAHEGRSVPRDGLLRRALPRRRPLLLISRRGCSRFRVRLRPGGSGLRKRDSLA